MICLFDRYDQASFDLLRSLKATGLDCPVVVVQDDGYLSPDVESPYSYFTGDLDTPEEKKSFHNIGYIYDYQRLNNMNPEALILTNSDQLEQIEQLLTQLPNVHFHIGAITEMSGHLMGLNRYPNVSLYPNIRPAKVAELFERCDLYLDINISDEILNACRTAFENNILILSFTNTCHSRRFIADDHIYAPENVSGVVDKIQNVLAHSSEMEAALARQKQAANQASLEQYKAIL